MLAGEELQSLQELQSVRVITAALGQVDNSREVPPPGEIAQTNSDRSRSPGDKEELVKAQPELPEVLL